VLLRCYCDCLRYAPPRKGSSASVSFAVTEAVVLDEALGCSGHSPKRSGPRAFPNVSRFCVIWRVSHGETQ
jgi:hypothetical protein